MHHAQSIQFVHRHQFNVTSERRLNVTRNRRYVIQLLKAPSSVAAYKSFAFCKAVPTVNSTCPQACSNQVKGLLRSQPSVKLNPLKL